MQAIPVKRAGEHHLIKDLYLFDTIYQPDRTACGNANGKCKRTESYEAYKYHYTHCDQYFFLILFLDNSFHQFSYFSFQLGTDMTEFGFQ